MEVVGQALRAAQAQAQTAAAGVTVLQCLRDVGDAGAFVGEAQAQALLQAVMNARDVALAAAAVVERVARQFACRRDELGLVDDIEAGFDGSCPDGLADQHHVFLTSERNASLLGDRQP